MRERSRQSDAGGNKRARYPSEKQATGGAADRAIRTRRTTDFTVAGSMRFGATLLGGHSRIGRKKKREKTEKVFFVEVKNDVHSANRHWQLWV